MEWRLCLRAGDQAGLHAAKCKNDSRTKIFSFSLFSLFAILKAVYNYIWSLGTDGSLLCAFMKEKKHNRGCHLFLRDQMFVYMLAESLFHLYLYKEQQKNALSSVVKAEILTAFCHFFSEKNWETAGTSGKEDRDAQRDWVRDRRSCNDTTSLLMSSHPISHLVWCVTPHYATGAAVHECVKASTQTDLSTPSLRPTACLCFWIACMWPCVLRWQPASSPVSVSSSIETSATGSPCARFKVTMATLRIKPEMLQTNQNRAFTVGLHCGEDRVGRPGGLSWIIAPRARDRTGVQPWLQGAGAHSRGDGREPEVSPRAVHRTSSPSWQQCEVFLSRTRTANSNPWPAAMLLSVTNTGPIYRSSPPPQAVGTPHNDSVAAVTDVSMLLMFTVVLCIVCWYPRKDLHKRETKNQSVIVTLCQTVYDLLPQTNISYSLWAALYLRPSLMVNAQEMKEPCHLMAVSLWGYVIFTSLRLTLTFCPPPDLNWFIL